MAKRDVQRSRVYASERGAWQRTTPLTPADSEALVREVMECKVTRRKWELDKVFPIKVEFGGTRWARAGFASIRLPANTVTRLVLHEVAHCINRQRAVCLGLPDPEPHGWLWCSIYLDLVHRFMSRLDADALRAHFKFNRVKYTAPRAKRELTEAQRAALARGRQRLAAGRK